jgi:hypothetical protein
MTRKDVNIQADAMTAQAIYEYVRDEASQEWYTMLSNTNFSRLQGYANSLSSEVVEADRNGFMTRWGNYKRVADTRSADVNFNGTVSTIRTIVNTTTDYGRDENGNPIIINNNPE